MEHIKKIRDYITRTLDKPFTIRDIADIAHAIEDLERIEAFVCGSDDKTPWMLSNIADELGGAEKYYKQWQTHGNEVAKSIGRIELEHAENWIKQARAESLIIPDSYLRKYQELVQKLA